MVAVGAEPAPCSQEGRGTGGKDRVPPMLLQLRYHQHCWQVERRDSAFAWARSCLQLVPQLKGVFATELRKFGVVLK